MVEILTMVCKDKNSQNWSGFEVQCDKYLKENKNSLDDKTRTELQEKDKFIEHIAIRINKIFNKLNKKLKA